MSLLHFTNYTILKFQILHELQKEKKKKITAVKQEKYLKYLSIFGYIIT